MLTIDSLMKKAIEEQPKLLKKRQKETGLILSYVANGVRIREYPDGRKEIVATWEKKCPK